MLLSGEDVKAIRVKMDLTQSEFAHLLGVTQTWISYIETGQRQVTGKLRIKIAQTFGVGPEIKKAIADAKASAELASQ